MKLGSKQRLRFWKLNADQVEHDHWIRFVIYWMIFDACVTEESGKDEDSEKLKWFFNNSSTLKTIFRDFWKASDYLEILNYLKTLSPVEDMRPTKRGKVFIKLNDILDENEVFRFIYQIRCNTFHGAKDLRSVKDVKLARYAEILLDEPLNRFLGLNK